MSEPKASKLVRLTTNNQVAIPAFIVRDLHLQKGAYLEVSEQGSRIVMTPKRVVDTDDYAAYEKFIKKGRSALKLGKTVNWDTVKKKLQ